MIEVTPNEDPEAAKYCNSYALSLKTRFERTGSLNDLNLAIAILERAVTRAPDDPAYSSNLACAIGSRYRQNLLAVDDLNRSIELHIQTIASATAADDPKFSVYLQNFGGALLDKFQCLGQMEDLNHAITVLEQVIAITPTGHSSLSDHFHNLSVALMFRYEETGSMLDLDCAITKVKEALGLTRPSDPYYALCLDHLGSCSLLRFQQTGSIDDLDAALSAKEQAMEITSEDHVDFVVYLTNLAKVLIFRFRRTDSMGNLDQATGLLERALKLIPETHYERPDVLYELCHCFREKFLKTRSLDLINTAVEYEEQALSLIPQGHSRRYMHLSRLALNLRTRATFDSQRLLDDLPRAAKASTEAVSLTMNRLENPNCLSELSRTLILLFQYTQSSEALDRGIEAAEQAVKMTETGHPNRGRILFELGCALGYRAERPDSHCKEEDLERAITMLECAVADPTSAPLGRIRAAERTVQMLAGRDKHRLERLLQIVVGIFPLLTPRSFRQSEMQYGLSQVAGITSKTVSLALECGRDPYKALEIFELGRGVIANLQLEVRSDISGLMEIHPDLANKLEGLREQLAHLQDVMRGPDLASAVRAERTYRSASKKFECLLKEIRQLDDFHQFFLAPSKAELKSLTASGCIVVFNVSDFRADALLVTAERIWETRLPLLKFSELTKRAERFLRTVRSVKHSMYTEARKEVASMLKWLWNVAVGPVLVELEHMAPGVDTINARLKIWWVASGVLSLLPIHAAGHHDAVGQNAIDRVVSSYAPSIRALIYARQRLDKALLLEKQNQNVVIIAMSKTPGEIELLSTEKEADRLQELFRSKSILTSILHCPTRGKVMSVLRDNQVAHFSCHGYGFSEDPAENKLLLSDWRTAPLTVSDIASLNLPFAQFAYLGVCHTSTSRNIELLDESITLSASMMLAGYPSVVGTLWYVTDEHSVEVVEDVYGSMLNGTDKIDPQRSADGLNLAVRNLRERARCFPGLTTKLPDDPLIWASYVHLGL